jgi:hypothetical protein
MFMWTASTSNLNCRSSAAVAITPKRQKGDAMQVQPYLFFEGRCEEALNFYRQALGAEVTMLMRYKDNPEPQAPGMCPPGSENKVMHSSFNIGQTMLMASDGLCQGKPSFQSACSACWPMAGRCRCRSARHSFHRCSA